MSNFEMNNFDFDFEIRFNISTDSWNVVGVPSKTVYIYCSTRESALSWVETLREQLDNGFNDDEILVA